MAKRALRYGLYFFAGLWMFTLGVMVGRGNSPVSFDTRGFQARLKAIAQEYAGRENLVQKVDLKFYEVLDEPVGVKGRLKKAGEIVPAKAPVKVTGADPDTAETSVPIKLSKKTASLNADRLAAYQDNDNKRPAKTVSAPPKKAALAAVKPGGGAYTIQVAAFKALKDAVAQMAVLEKKGISVYKVKSEQNGITWYRVRTGSFADKKAALDGLKKLKTANVNGMIIKKE